MAEPRNSNCWYIDSCNDTCDNCITYLQMKWQMENSGLPESQQHRIELHINENNMVDKKAYKQLADIRKHVVEFVQSGSNLYLCSTTPGNGKTSWSIKILQTYFHYTSQGNYENLKGMFVSTLDLLLKLKDFNNPLPKKYRDNLENVDLVIFDDIALTGISQYDFTQLYSIINNRIFAGKSNIFTSNVTDYEQLQKILGARLASRIYNTSEIIELKGMDMR